MYKGMSSLRTTGPYFTHAISWWYFPVVDGNAWFIGSLWQERTEKLFTLTGQVTRKVGKR